MKLKNKQKSIAQNLLLAGIITGILAVSSLSFGFSEYKNLSSKLTESQRFIELESYDEAIFFLEEARASWLVASVGMKSEGIERSLEEIKTRKKHKDIYENGLNLFEEAGWEEAIDILAEIPIDSFYYYQSQSKTEKIKRMIAEEELSEEQVVRKEEQTARQIAERKALVEAEKRAVEELSRKEAEQYAEQERLSREQQERETEAQKLLTKQQEKEKVLEIARTNPLVKAIISGELKIYFDPLPSYAASGVSNMITAAVNDFTKLDLGVPVNIRRVYNPNDADVTVSWIRDYGEHTIGQAIFRSHVKVGLGTNNCLGQWRAFDSITVGRILWHELGHSMGYGHSNIPNNVMYHEMHTFFQVDHEVSEVISGGWYSVIPFCGGSSYGYSFQTDSAYSGFDIYVIPPGQDPYEISAGEGRYYPDCSASDVSRYSGSCTVPSGSKIYIGNTSFRDAIRLSGKIINTRLPSIPDLNWDSNAFRYDINDLRKYWNLFHGE